MAQELPEHVVFFILLWLPVKSLLRFKAVCKYWKCMLYNVGRHARLSRAQFLMLIGDKFDEASICLDFAYEELRKYKINPLFVISRLCVGNTCNGIICLHFQETGSEDVALWNPATKQLRPLPLPQFPISRSRPPKKYISTYPLLGFDIKTNDYKVVNIIQSNIPYKYNEFYNLSQVEWHWVLISFDFSMETFRFMPMPNTSKEVSTFALDFLDDNLICFNSSVFEPCNNLNNRHFDIWVLHGYGTKEFWTKLYTIGPFDSFIPIKFLKEREFLLLFYNCKLCLYNRVTQEMQEFHYQDPYFRPAFVIYNESLVSIKGENDAANRETSLLQFARVCGDDPETEEEEDEMDEERVESQSEEEEEEENQEDGEIKDLENQISNELGLGGLGLKHGFESCSSKDGGNT
ncbi:hypothetical protein AQUCO_12400006v1 [Aquilegia coerulea]|uniref:F-box domain-containing protein n=1 Tax=Aquilegia coerulea TaxID=218851 RepID=A0A2G5C1H5_AQUCA|nr:hypothetical protein AQUCO_12400006v1 [Aquilegia coerulea]